MIFASSHRSVLQALLAGTALLCSSSALALAQETPPESAPVGEAPPPAEAPAPV
ncbi:hypothetical protein HMI50_44275, partial [Corallococcus carmarthensis]|nr:hypothetical protein [Corallococcus carmarthensis]